MSERALGQMSQEEESRHVLEYLLFPDRIFDYVTRFCFRDCPGGTLLETVERHRGTMKG